MRILITGATGFIGRKLLKYLIYQQHTVAIHTRKQPEGTNSNFLVFSGELNQFQKQIIEFSPEFVFHLAGSSIYPKNAEEECELWSANVHYGNTLLGIIKEIPNLVFVNFTTSLAYEGTTLSPYSYYALTKANFIQSLEFYARIYDLKIFNLILYSVYGEGDLTKRALNYILESIDSKQPISMSPGEQLMDFIHVNDIISLCLQLLEKIPRANLENIHVGTGTGRSLIDVANLIETLCHQKTNIKFGSISYRKEEKMDNVAPILANRFWRSTISFDEGIVSLVNRIRRI